MPHVQALHAVRPLAKLFTYDVDIDRAAALVQRVEADGITASTVTDSEHKRELDPMLLAESVIVEDILEQCAAIGELHHGLGATAWVLTCNFPHDGPLFSRRAQNEILNSSPEPEI